VGGGGGRDDSVRCLLDQKTSSPAHTGQRFSGCLLCAMFSLGRGVRGGGGRGMTQSGAYWTRKQAPQLIQGRDLVVVFSVLCFL
jgi:hypothetical protein